MCLWGLESRVQESCAESRGEAEGMLVEEAGGQSPREGGHAGSVRSMNTSRYKATCVNCGSAVYDATTCQCSWQASHEARKCQATIFGDVALGPTPAEVRSTSSTFFNNPSLPHIPAYAHSPPRQLRFMASIAAACRLSARAASQQLRNHGSRRGRKSARGVRNPLTVSTQRSRRDRSRSRRRTSTCPRSRRR